MQMPFQGEFKRIFVRAPNWVGDAVAATAVFRELRRSYPKAYITIAARPNLEPLMRAGQWANRFMPLEDKTSSSQSSLHEIKKEQFDLALLLPNSFRSAWLPFLAGIPHRVGYAGNLRSPLLTRRLKAPREGFRRVPVPMIYSYVNLLGLIGVAPHSIRPELFYEDSTKKEALTFLDERGITAKDRYAVISPGASFGSSKLWKPDRFAATVDGLYEKFGLKSYVHSGPGEEALVAEITKLAKHKPAIAGNAPRDLHQLKPIVDGAALLVCTDSGPRHYGVAFDKPIVCLMGPTSPLYTHANMEKTELVRVEVDCGPCQLKVCPLDHRCMEQISSDMVLAACERLLTHSRS